MNRAIYFFVLLLGVAVGFSCRKSIVTPDTTADLPPAMTPELRIFNATPWKFYNCTVDPSGTLSDNPGPDAFEFGQVGVNAKTGYKSFSKLFRYSWVRLKMKYKTYYLKPYDYTGETPLQTGRYTYKLTYAPTNDRLNLELIKD